MLYDERSMRLVVRGSLWYWIKNRHLYPQKKLIENLIAEKAPLVAQIVEIPPYNPELPSIEFEITDDWVAANVERRHKMAWVTAIITAPAPVKVHLFKHKHGFVENEVSRRYVTDSPEFFLPEHWRKSSPDIKQGSLDELVDDPRRVEELVQYLYKLCNTAYHTLLSWGVCAEQARFVLPDGRLTQWYWTGSLDALMRAYRQRVLHATGKSQEETCQTVKEVMILALERWPQTVDALLSISSES